MVSESSELSQLSELIELPEVFSSMEKCLLHQTLRPGDLLLELRLVSRSSETSRSSGTSQSFISSCPAFPDVGERSIECIHISFTEEKRAYILYNHEQRWLIKLRDVEFEEEEFLMISCKPRCSTKHTLFTPILVEMNPVMEGIHSKCNQFYSIQSFYHF